MDILDNLQKRNRPKALLELRGLDVDSVGHILHYLDIPSLGRAEQVCQLFQLASQNVWKELSKIPLAFTKTSSLVTASSQDSATNACAADCCKGIVRRWRQARIHGEKHSAVVREHFFDRETADAIDDIQGWSRLPRLNTSVLLSKFVPKYDFFFQIALIRRRVPLAASTSRTISDGSHDVGTGPASTVSREGAVDVIFEGFLSGTPATTPNSRYVSIKWDIQDLYHQRLQPKWQSLNAYLQAASRMDQPGDLEEAFRSVFITGTEIPEVTISAVAATGKPRLVFATGGIEPGTTAMEPNTDIVLMDRIAEQHPMLTHHFGIVPRVSLTMRPSADRTGLESMELQFQGSPR